MKSTWLTLRDLEYLTAIDRARHFGRAAREVGTSQPTLSAQLKKVEGWLGFPLFERSRSGVRTTPRGERVVEYAQRVLEEASRISEMSDETTAPLTGRFKLGAIASLGPYLFPHLVPPLKRRYPNLALQLVEGLTQHLLDDLKAGKLDAVLAAPTFDPRGFSVLPLFFEPFVVMTPKVHPFAKRASIKRSELDVKEMILLEDGHCLADQTVELCPPKRRGGPTSGDDFHATSLETLKQLVALDAGYTLIPLLAAKEDPGIPRAFQVRASRGRIRRSRDRARLAQGLGARRGSRGVGRSSHRVGRRLLEIWPQNQAFARALDAHARLAQNGERCRFTIFAAKLATKRLKSRPPSARSLPLAPRADRMRVSRSK